MFYVPTRENIAGRMILSRETVNLQLRKVFALLRLVSEELNSRALNQPIKDGKQKSQMLVRFKFELPSFEFRVSSLGVRKNSRKV